MQQLNERRDSSSPMSALSAGHPSSIVDTLYSQHLDNGAQPSREILARGVIKVEPFLGCAPGFETFFQSAAIDMRACAVLPHISERLTRKGRGYDRFVIVARNRVVTPVLAAYPVFRLFW